MFSQIIQIMTYFIATDEQTVSDVKVPSAIPDSNCINANNSPTLIAGRLCIYLLHVLWFIYRILHLFSLQCHSHHLLVSHASKQLQHLLRWHRRELHSNVNCTLNILIVNFQSGKRSSVNNWCLYGVKQKWGESYSCNLMENVFHDAFMH